MPSSLELFKGRTSKGLTGLSAKDRTREDQESINEVMGYRDNLLQTNTPETVYNQNDAVVPSTISSSVLQQGLRYNQHLQNLYEEELAKRQEDYGVNRNSVNSNANEYIDNIANEVSSYYKRFKGSDKLPISDQEYKELAAEYDARKATRGEDAANIWLDKQFKNKVGENQEWWEQAMNAFGHLGPAIEGGAIQAYGMAHGAINHILGTEGYNDNPDLNWWDSFIDDVLDNPVTRYGRDVEWSGASNVLQGFTNLLGINDETAAERIAATKASATRYNPEGIGADAIVTTEEQDQSLLSSATPWKALQSGGFTALSMLVGAGEAALANRLFSWGAKGINWLNSTGKVFKTAEALEKGLEGVKKIQNFTNMFVIPGTVGSMEGAIEGLSTKIDIEREAVQNLDDYYKDKINKEAQALYEQRLSEYDPNELIEERTDRGKTLRTKPAPTFQDAFKDTWDKYQDEYMEARRQIDWAASKAGIHNFWANSLINGAINQTLKAGIMAPRVQETLRNSKLFGWAYRDPKFRINPETNIATPVRSKFGAAKQIIKEPIGEGLEEYAQSLSNDVFTGAAENNIHEFIERKFSGDSTVKVTDSFGSDWAASLAALEGSLTNKESIESAILGAVSSTMGTVGGVGRGYHRDENGNLVRNSLINPRNFARGLDSKGNRESWTDYARRVTPWRSGAVNAYFDWRKEMDEADETAEALTEWLKVPENRAKWDGLQGTAGWLTKLQNAAESNDQFNFRNAQMGKAINDVFMIQKLQGTDFYDSIMQDLQRASSGEVTQEEIQQIRQQSGDAYQDMSDEEVVEKIRSNANQMLGLMSTVEKEGKNLDRMLGRVDEDTKQSLIFGKIMKQDFKERRDKLEEEINTIKDQIANSTRSNVSSGMTDDLKKLIIEYGSINKALKTQSSFQEQRDKTQKRVEELEAIDSKKRSDKQNEELLKGKNLLKALNKKLTEFDALYKKDENGKKTSEIDSSLSQMVLNEQDIMDLDPVTRAVMLAQGATRQYNATHQNQQKIDQLNLEIDALDEQIEKLNAQTAGWIVDGRVKKHHYKQVARNNKQAEELWKQKDAKMRALDAEQGKLDTKPIYNSAQQEVIDNLVAQLNEFDENGQDFLNKVVDMGRLEQKIKDFQTEYQSILSDPRAFSKYVQRVKYNAQRDLTRRRAERVANIEDFQEYSQELDRLKANASQQELNDIFGVLRQKSDQTKREYAAQNPQNNEEEGVQLPQTNYDRYMDNVKKRAELVKQFAKNPNLTDNDMSLLDDAMEYLQSKGVDVTDREAAVDALLEKDEDGNLGGEFRKYVEKKNSNLPLAARTYMPTFTTIGQIVNDYVDILNGQKEDEINRQNLNPTFKPANTETAQPTVVTTPTPTPSPTPTLTPEQAAAGAGLMAIGGSSPDDQQLNADNNVTTGAQTQSMQQRLNPQQTVAKQRVVDQFSDLIYGNINNSRVGDEAKALVRQYFDDSDVTDVDDLLTDIQAQRKDLMERFTKEGDERLRQAAGLMDTIYNKLNAQKMKGKEKPNKAPPLEK